MVYGEKGVWCMERKECDVWGEWSVVYGEKGVWCVGRMECGVWRERNVVYRKRSVLWSGIGSVI